MTKILNYKILKKDTGAIYCLARQDDWTLKMHVDGAWLMYECFNIGTDINMYCAVPQKNALNNARILHTLCNCKIVQNSELIVFIRDCFCTVNT